MIMYEKNTVNKNKDERIHTSERSGELVNSMIRFVAAATALSVAVTLPGMAKELDNLLKALDTRLDERERQQKIRRTIYYMKSRGLLAGEYEHGLHLTDKAKRRLEQVELDDVTIQPATVWDGKWHITIYDIPEEYRQARASLTARLRQIGCFQLQKSAWITPFECREIIEAICTRYGIDRYVTYFQVIELANDQALLKRFAKKYPGINFSR